MASSSSSSSSSSSTRMSFLGKLKSCYLEWMTLQEKDLSEMPEAQACEENCVGKDVLMGQLIDKNVEHYEKYAEQRSHLAQQHVCPFFAPPWCSFLESSQLCLGGCQPSIFIRLIYTLSTAQTEAQTRAMLEGGAPPGGEGEFFVSSDQYSMINQLHLRTVKKEEKLSEEMAHLQEKIADQPFAVIAKEMRNVSVDEISFPNEKIDEALDDHARSMARILEEADKFRISTLKEVMKILNPAQAMDFLIASKKLHICIHNWGKRRDLKHASTTS